MGRSAVSSLRDHLAAELAKKVQAHGLVVWEDTAGEYDGQATAVVPDGVRFEAYQGSWYELRRRIEDVLGGDHPPRLVIYGPGAPSDDPLAEVRAAGARFTLRLATLVKQALSGQLTEARIKEIGRQARTLTEAEAAIEGDAGTDVRLISLFGTADSARMLTMVLSDQADGLDDPGTRSAIAALCRDTVGAQVDAASGSLVDDLFQHLLLTEVAASLEGSLPEALQRSWDKPTAAQARTACEVLERLRSVPGGMRRYRELAGRADDRLSLAEAMPWEPGLARVVGTEAIELVLFRHAAESLHEGGEATAGAIAGTRLTISPWVADPDSPWGARWRAVEAIAGLQRALAAARIPRAGSLDLAWYVDRGWEVYRAHRRLELARTELGVFGELEDALTAARIAYGTWLDELLTRFTDALAKGALDPGEIIRQGEVHQRFVAEGAGHKTAYIWVDALRYELGKELAEALRPVAERVQIEPAVAAAPTITPVGMANLLPDAASNLRVGLDGDKIVVTVGTTTVMDVPARRDLLRARHGQVADLDLNDAAQKGEKALANAIGSADLVLIRSQEVDAAGESGLLSVAWSHFETVINLLASVIARLAQAGVERVVISADHGFIALGQDLGANRVVDAPAGATGTTKRRVFVGRGGVPNPATVRIPLATCGVVSDLDIVVPRGLAVFKAGGGRQFFHGGLSPQELIVPVVVVDLTKAPEPQKLHVTVQVAGGRITTGVFAATIAMADNLLFGELVVRVVVTDPAGHPVARIVSGDHLDTDTGTVTVSSDGPSVVTFQVTANLDAGSDVVLELLDARTGRKVATSTVAVAAPITVEDSLD